MLLPCKLDYDAQRRLVRKDTPEGVLAYTYDAVGAVATLKGYGRNAVGINASPGGANPDVLLGYGYDRLGRLASVTNFIIPEPYDPMAATNINPQFNPQPSDPNPNVTWYYYDAVGNLDYFTYPSGLRHTYTYTEQNRLKLLKLTQGNGVLVRSFAYELNPAGHRTSVTESNLSGNTAVQRRRVLYEYDVSHAATPVPVPRVYRLTQATLYGANNATAVGSETHVYDPVGNRTARSEHSGESHPTATKEQLLEQAKKIDDLFGSQFNPPIRQ